MPRSSKYAPDQIHARPETVRGFRNMLLDLIVDAERAAWILATYPPEETGRPGIIVAQERKRAHKTEKRKGEMKGEDLNQSDGVEELDELVAV